MIFQVNPLPADNKPNDLYIIIPPANFVCGGYTVFTVSVCASVRPSVRPSVTFCYAPAIYNGGGGGGGAYSITLVRTYIRTYVQQMVSGGYLLNTLVYWIHISYTGI